MINDILSSPYIDVEHLDKSYRLLRCIKDVIIYNK